MSLLSDDRTSDEAKANAQHKLADLGVDSYGETGAPVANDTTIEEDVVEDDEFTNRQLGGFKAALKSKSSNHLFVGSRGRVSDSTFL